MSSLSLHLQLNSTVFGSHYVNVTPVTFFMFCSLTFVIMIFFFFLMCSALSFVYIEIKELSFTKMLK